MTEEALIPVHGGYRKLKSFQVAQLVYDLTTRFCDRYVDRRSRTHNQMVQAARSGVPNIAEGSAISATSKKMEIKLTQVARASLEALRLDYEDFLRPAGSTDRLPSRRLREGGRLHGTTLPRALPETSLVMNAMSLSQAVRAGEPFRLFLSPPLRRPLRPWPVRAGDGPQSARLIIFSMTFAPLIPPSDDYPLP